jgi:hypothetical protein
LEAHKLEESEGPVLKTVGAPTLGPPHPHPLLFPSSVPRHACAIPPVAPFAAFCMLCCVLSSKKHCNCRPFAVAAAHRPNYILLSLSLSPLALTLAACIPYHLLVTSVTVKGEQNAQQRKKGVWNVCTEKKKSSESWAELREGRRRGNGDEGSGLVSRGAHSVAARFCQRRAGHTHTHTALCLQTRRSRRGHKRRETGRERAAVQVFVGKSPSLRQ